MKKTALVLTLVVLAAASTLQAQVSEQWPAQRRLKITINAYLEFHNYLNVAATSTVDQPEYLSQVNTYRQARELISDPLAWRFVNDAIVEGPDIDAIAGRVNQIPASLSAADAEAVKKILQALKDGWPRYEAHMMMERSAALQRFAAGSLRRKFINTVEVPYMMEVYRLFGFSDIDAPITLLPVIETVELGDWGRSSAGYYVVLPSASRSYARAMDEDIVHEVIHVLDIAQPAGSQSVLRKIRAAGSTVDPQEMQLFLHGLVVWTSGEIVRRTLPTPYEPAHKVLENTKAQVDIYRAIYEGPWQGYIDGHLEIDRAIQGMVSGLKPKTP